MINKIHNENCLDTMSRMDDNFLDLTVTSPPYDNLRAYNDNIDESWGEHVWTKIIDELYRVTKPGGTVVWVVGDAAIKGSETGSSFKQALYAIQAGFRLHDTMIYEKNSCSFPARRDGGRYTQIFEYMFVWTKGAPKASLICDKKNKWAGHTSWGNLSHYSKDEMVKKDKKLKPVPDFSPRNNIWKYSTGVEKVKGHPAIFPIKLAEDHILTWSGEDDIVYDPFMGSGTTALAASQNKRNYIGSELSEEYYDISQKRLTKQLNLL